MKTVWITLFTAFSLVNVYAFTAGDQFSGLWLFLKNLGPWGILTVVDLLIAISVALYFLIGDARSASIKPLPYVLLTLCTGSLGLLLYLIQHGRHPGQRALLASSR